MMATMIEKVLVIMFIVIFLIFIGVKFMNTMSSNSVKIDVSEEPISGLESLNYNLSYHKLVTHPVDFDKPITGHSFTIYIDLTDFQIYKSGLDVDLFLNSSTGVYQFTGKTGVYTVGDKSFYGVKVSVSNLPPGVYNGSGKIHYGSSIIPFKIDNIVVQQLGGGTSNVVMVTAAFETEDINNNVYFPLLYVLSTGSIKSYDGLRNSVSDLFKLIVPGTYYDSGSLVMLFSMYSKTKTDQVGSIIEKSSTFGGDFKPLGKIKDLNIMFYSLVEKSGGSLFIVPRVTVDLVVPVVDSVFSTPSFITIKNSIVYANVPIIVEYNGNVIASYFNDNTYYDSSYVSSFTIDTISIQSDYGTKVKIYGYKLKFTSLVKGDVTVKSFISTNSIDEGTIVTPNGLVYQFSNLILVGFSNSERDIRVVKIDNGNNNGLNVVLRVPSQSFSLLNSNGGVDNVFGEYIMGNGYVIDTSLLNISKSCPVQPGFGIKNRKLLYYDEDDYIGFILQYDYYYSDCVIYNTINMNGGIKVITTDNTFVIPNSIGKSKVSTDKYDVTGTTFLTLTKDYFNSLSINGNDIDLKKMTSNGIVRFKTKDDINSVSIKIDTSNKPISNKFGRIYSVEYAIGLGGKVGSFTSIHCPKCTITDNVGFSGTYSVKSGNTDHVLKKIIGATHIIVKPLYLGSILLVDKSTGYYTIVNSSVPFVIMSSGNSVDVISMEYNEKIPKNTFINVHTNPMSFEFPSKHIINNYNSISTGDSSSGELFSIYISNYWEPKLKIDFESILEFKYDDIKKIPVQYNDLVNLLSEGSDNKNKEEITYSYVIMFITSVGQYNLVFDINITKNDNEYTILYMFDPDKSNVQIKIENGKKYFVIPNGIRSNSLVIIEKLVETKKNTENNEYEKKILNSTINTFIFDEQPLKEEYISGNEVYTEDTNIVMKRSTVLSDKECNYCKSINLDIMTVDMFGKIYETDNVIVNDISTDTVYIYGKDVSVSSLGTDNFIELSFPYIYTIVNMKYSYYSGFNPSMNIMDVYSSDYPKLNLYTKTIYNTGLRQYTVIVKGGKINGKIIPFVKIKLYGIILVRKDNDQIYCLFDGIKSYGESSISLVTTLNNVKSGEYDVYLLTNYGIYHIGGLEVKNTLYGYYLLLYSSKPKYGKSLFMELNKQYLVLNNYGDVKTINSGSYQLGIFRQLSNIVEGGYIDLFIPYTFVPVLNNYEYGIGIPMINNDIDHVHVEYVLKPNVNIEGEKIIVGTYDIPVSSLSKIELKDYGLNRVLLVPIDKRVTYYSLVLTYGSLEFKTHIYMEFVNKDGTVVGSLEINPITVIPVGNKVFYTYLGVDIGSSGYETRLIISYFKSLDGQIEPSIPSGKIKIDMYNGTDYYKLTKYSSSVSDMYKDIEDKLDRHIMSGEFDTNVDSEEYKTQTLYGIIKMSIGNNYAYSMFDVLTLLMEHIKLNTYIDTEIKSVNEIINSYVIPEKIQLYKLDNTNIYFTTFRFHHHTYFVTLIKEKKKLEPITISDVTEKGGVSMLSFVYKNKEMKFVVVERLNNSVEVYYSLG